jgi:hypothetical protein
MAATTFVEHPTPPVGTHTHPVYSENRCGHISLGDREPGERLRTAERPAEARAEARAEGATVVSFVGTLQTEMVYRQDSALHRGRGRRCTSTPQCSMITSGSPPTRDPPAPKRSRLRRSGKGLSMESGSGQTARRSSSSRIKAIAVVGRR